MFFKKIIKSLPFTLGLVLSLTQCKNASFNAESDRQGTNNKTDKPTRDRPTPSGPTGGPVAPPSPNSFSIQIRGMNIEGPSYAVFLRDTSWSMMQVNSVYGNNVVTGIMNAASARLAGISFCADGGTKTGAVYNMVNSLRGRMGVPGGNGHGSCPANISMSVRSLPPGSKLGIIIFSDWRPPSFNFSNTDIALKAFTDSFSATIPNIARTQVFWLTGGAPDQLRMTIPHFEGTGLGRFYSYTSPPNIVIDEVARNLSAPVIESIIQLPPEMAAADPSRLRVTLNGAPFENSKWTISNGRLILYPGPHLQIGQTLNVSLI